ncbi:hypothetical protein F2P56_017770 [Juglans regia]|uniref:Uncharacterized protein LOC109006180 isoform X3 n=2 Tax=Juglans regia TaxID=51240 RepID=A0A2I4GAI1_JUGRE|nr:uncharacterized protein LOC109006180 isoform X3 [Juglans regia]KAF5461693.1 hypothetical protein F2P56_017770 [Juglans regia]
MKEKPGQTEKEVQENSGLKTAGPEGEITAGMMDVHCNSFFPMFVLLYVIHYFLFMVAASYYHYLNFLGYDDFLELALQFGMIMMFACAFPLAFAFATLFHATQNNITEIKTDALKLLTMFKRPIPRAATTIGAWLNIFQSQTMLLLPQAL